MSNPWDSEIRYDVLNTNGEYFRQLPLDGVPTDCFFTGVEAFHAAMPEKSLEEIEEFMGNIPAVFALNASDPARGITQGRLNPNQSFANPTLVVAYHNWGMSIKEAEEKDTTPMQIVGYTFSADNVSGRNRLIRAAKQLKVVKNYRWIKAVAVKPEFQGQGIGSALSYLSLIQAKEKQPASAYAWPEEEPGIDTLLESIGMVATGSQTVKPFGNDTTISQTRFAALNAHEVAETIKSRSKLPDATFNYLGYAFNRNSQLASNRRRDRSARHPDLAGGK